MMREKKNAGSVTPPEGYVLNREIDLDGKFGVVLLLSLVILAVGVALCAVLAAVGVLPTVNFERFRRDPGGAVLLLAQLLFFSLLLALLFQLLLLPVKKLVLRRSTGLRANIEFKFTYISVSVPFYFVRSAYICSRLLATLIVGGVLLALIIVCVFLPEPLLLLAYAAFIIYLACCADDFYLVHAARKSPSHAIFYDMGRRFFVYLPQETAAAGK